MGTFTVDPASLSGLSSTLSSIHSQMQGMQGVASGYEGLLGGSDLEGEVSSFCSTWHYGISQLGQNMAEVVQRLDYAAAGYGKSEQSIVTAAQAEEGELMPDPLTDPRAAQLLATSPDEIDSLAGFFQSVSGRAEQASTGLQGAHGDETWTGGAADAFRAKLGKLPGDLSTVQSSYSDAAQALRTYATNVAPIKSQFQSLSQQLQSAQGQLTSAQGTLTTARGSLTSAQSNLTTAQNAPKAKPTDPAVSTAKGAVSSAQSNLASAQGAVSRLSGEVTGLSTHGCQLLDEFDTVRGHCRSAISTAGGKAPQHHSSFFGSLVSIGEDVVKGVAGAVVKLAKNIGDLPKAAYELATDPS